VEGRRRHRILVISQVIIGCGYLCVLLSGYLSIIGSIGFALAAVLLVTATELIQGPVVPAIMNESAGTGNRGRYTSLFQMGFVIGDLITPALITALLSRGALATWLPFAALALVDACAVALLARRMPQLRVSIGRSQDEGETSRILEADGL
jgi:MFS family permease